MPLAQGQALGQQPYMQQQQQSQQDGPSFSPTFQSHTFQQLQESEAVFQQFQQLSMQQRQQPQQGAYQSPVASPSSGSMPQAGAAAGMRSPMAIISNQQQQQQIMGGVQSYPASYAGSPALNSGQNLSQNYSPVAPQLQRHGSAPQMLDGYIANLGPAQQQRQQQQQSSQAQQQVYCAGDGGMQVAWIPVTAGPGGMAAQGAMGTTAATYQQPQQQQQQVVYAQQPQQLQQTVVLQQQPQQQQNLLQYNPSQQSYVTIPVQPSQQAVQYQQQQQVQVSACSLQEPMLIQTSECFFADSDGADLRVQSGGQGSGTMYVSQGSQLQSGFYRA